MNGIILLKDMKEDQNSENLNYLIYLTYSDNMIEIDKNIPIPKKLKEEKRLSILMKI